MNPKHYKQFAAVYGLLAFVTLVALVGAYKGLTYKSYKLPPSVAHKADINSALGEADLLKVACAYTTQSAAGQGVILNSCKKLKLVIKGNSATVTLHQTDTLGKKYTITVLLSKGVWTVAHYQVGPG